MAIEPRTKDIVERLRGLVGAPVSLRTNGLLEDAATEIENLRALLDQAGVTIAAAVTSGLPLPLWTAGPTKQTKFAYLVDSEGNRLISLWGDDKQRQLVAETILALINQPSMPK